MNKTLRLFLLLTLCLCCVPAYAAPGASAIRLDSADCSGWPTIVLKANLPANGASDKDISLSLPGLAQPLAPTGVKVLSDHSGAEALLVAIDTSKSLSDDFLEAIKTALRDYTRHLGKGEQIAILAFNDTVQIASGFTSSQASVEAALGTLRQGGVKTELYQALLTGANLLKQLSGKKAILVISDGHNEGAGELKDVVQAAREAGTHIYAIALPEKHKEQKLHQEQLQTLAGETGGVFQAVDSPLSAASGIFTILQAQRQKEAGGCDYQITFLAPAEFKVTERPLTAVLSWKNGGGALSVDVALNAPLTEKAPEPEKDAAQKALDFVKTPVGMGCAAGAALVLLLLAVLLWRARRLSAQKSQGEHTVLVSAQEPAASPFVLELVTQSMTFPLPYGKTRLGASRDNEIVVDDPTVSRKHACLEVVGQECRVTDSGSTNGTFVNGERITRSYILKSGDQLYFGKTQAYLRTVIQGGYHG